MILAQPVDGPRIVPRGEDRLPTDKLPNGKDGFRVTQSFGEELTKWGPHSGMDLGNFTCGDRVLACGDGMALAWKDSAGALCVTIDHGNGWKTIYAHLKDWVNIKWDGKWYPTKFRQQIGVVGDTGLGAVCHLHVEAHHSGIKRDPWLLLEQNQESLVLKGTFRRHWHNRRTATAVRANFREGPFGHESIINTFDAGTVFYPVIEVVGQNVGGNTRWFGGWLFYGGWKFGYFHRSGLGNFIAIESSGYTKAQLDAEVKKAVTAAVSEAVRLGAASVDAIRKLIP